MDRRTLLAFVLMFLVIMGFSELMRHDAAQNAGPTPSTTERAGEEVPAEMPRGTAPARPWRHGGVGAAWGAARGRRPISV